MKDSSSTFYSVYRGKQFNPNAWKDKLTAEQISDIEKHSLETFNTLMDYYSR